MSSQPPQDDSQPRDKLLPQDTLPTQDYINKTGVKKFQSEEQKTFNQFVANLMESALQVRKVGPIDYIQSRLPKDSAYIATLGGGGSKIEVIKKETPSSQEQKERFQLDSLGLYERIILSAVAWYQYDTYVIAGELGTGKTTTTTFLLDHLKKISKGAPETCRFCKQPIHIQINFNINFRSHSNDRLRRDLCEQLYNQLRLYLRTFFKSSTMATPFLKFLLKGGIRHQVFAVFDHWIEELENSELAFNDLNRDLKTSHAISIESIIHKSLFEFLKVKEGEYESSVKQLLAICRFIREEFDPDSWCFTLIFDNLDSVRPEGQGVLLQAILSFQEISQVKTLVPLRPSTFGSLDTERAFSYGLIEHIGPGILKVLKKRLEHLLENWSFDPGIIALPNDQMRERLHRRAEYVLEGCSTGGSMEIIEWLAGNNIRHGLQLALRSFKTEVVPHDLNPRHKYDNFRAILVGDSDSHQIERDDRFIANLYCQNRTGKFSTVNWRILQLAFGLENDASIRTVGSITQYLQMLTDFDPRQIKEAYNYLLDRSRQLLRVDGTSRLREQDLDSGRVVAITKAGKSYLLYIFRELAYVQECFTATLWNSERIPRVVNFRSIEERLRFVRKGIRLLMETDQSEVTRMRDCLGSEEIMPNTRLRLLSNRVLYKSAESALHLMRSNKRWYRQAIFIEELRDWENLLHLGFEAELDILKFHYARLKDLAGKFEEASSNITGPTPISSP